MWSRGGCSAGAHARHLQRTEINEGQEEWKAIEINVTGTSITAGWVIVIFNNNDDMELQ